MSRASGKGRGAGAGGERLGGSAGGAHPTLFLPEGAPHTAKHQAAQECNHLWRCALAVLPYEDGGREDQPAGGLASHYVRQLEVRASAAAIDITFLRAFYCQACRTPFLPGVTCRVRLHARGRDSAVQKRLQQRKNKRNNGASAGKSDEIPVQEVAYTCRTCDSTVLIAGGTRKQRHLKHTKRLQERAQKKSQDSSAAAIAAARDQKAKAKASMAPQDPVKEHGDLRSNKIGASGNHGARPVSSAPASFIGERAGRPKKKRKKKSSQPSGLSKFLGSL